MAGVVSDGQGRRRDCIEQPELGEEDWQREDRSIRRVSDRRRVGCELGMEGSSSALHCACARNAVQL